MDLSGGQVEFITDEGLSIFGRLGEKTKDLLPHRFQMKQPRPAYSAAASTFFLCQPGRLMEGASQLLVPPSSSPFRSRPSRCRGSAMGGP